MKRKRNRGSSPHIGTDFYSLGDGVIADIGTVKKGSAKGAKYITVEYEGGDQVRFLHLNSVADGLEVGGQVYEGQILGETGKTGTTQKHLHVDAKDKNGKRIDPENKNYGSVPNKEFFETFGGDYKKLKEYKDSIKPVSVRVDNTKVEENQ